MRTVPASIESDVAAVAGGKGRRPKKAPPFLHIPTGSTLLNLALSNDINGGYRTGRLANLIGDSQSGKTLEALSMFAECARIRAFDKYRFIYDEPEAANGFDIQGLFGKEVARRLEDDYHSEDVGQFKENILSILTDKKPFIYVLDSVDSLDGVDGKDDGYGTSKAKMFSRTLGRICRKLKKTQSFLLLISQTRDNISATFNKKTRSGGRALKFYASYEMWLAVIKAIKGKDNIIIGSQAAVKVSKNKTTGNVRTVSMPIYSGYGVDDIGSCLDYLIEHGRGWRCVKKKGEKSKCIHSPLFPSMPRSKLIRYIEDSTENLEALREAVGELWAEVENGLKLDRKPKYE